MLRICNELISTMVCCGYLESSHIYPIEFLNSLNTSGLPLAHLDLKLGCPLMLLHHIDIINGLCNGTRMILLEVRQRVLRCRILGGNHAGQEVFIPRLNIHPSEVIFLLVFPVFSFLFVLLLL